MDVATVVLTGLGLSGAAGLNAYIPLFVVGLLGRFDVVELASPYDVVASTPVLLLVLIAAVAWGLARLWRRRSQRAGQERAG